MRPGTALRFKAVTRAEAVALLAAERTALDAFRAHLVPASSAADLSSERLLSLNLLDGWTAGG
jgi:hypothetical protein